MAQNPQDAAMIDQIAAQAMGVAPQQPQEPAADAKKRTAIKAKQPSRAVLKLRAIKLPLKQSYMRLTLAMETIANSHPNKSNQPLIVTQRTELQERAVQASHGCD